jgi:hypothetical protein
MSDDEEYEYEYDDDDMEEDNFEYTDEEEQANDAEVALGTSHQLLSLPLGKGTLRLML